MNGKVVKVTKIKRNFLFAITIEDERGKEHTGTLDSVFAKGGITYTDKRDGAVYTTGKNDRGEWTVYSESPNWAKRDEFENGLESEEDAIMLAKQMSGIEVEREPFAQGGEVANTILQQLGGAGKLRMMTGAYNFIDTGNGVSFRLKNPRANFVKIKLNGKDLYDIEVGRVRGNTYKIVKEQNDLFFDQLKPFIEEATGLYLSLFSNGGLVENPVFTFKTQSDYYNGRNSGYDFDIVRVVVGNSDFPVYSEEEYEELLAAGNITSSYQDKSYYDIQDYEVDEDDDTEADDGGYMADGGKVYKNLSDIPPTYVNEPKSKSKDDGLVKKIKELELVKTGEVEFGNDYKISKSSDCVKIFMEFWDENSLNVSEHFNVLLLSKANIPIGIYQHSRGGIDGTIADIEMICLAAVKSLAKGVVVAHNHPSGNLTPSDSDKKLTQELKKALSVFKISLLDSLIITPKNGYYSMNDEGYMADGGKVGYYAKGSKVKKRARFVDKVEAIADSLEGKKVPRRLQNDYGKRYNRDEAEQAGRRIAGSMKKKYEI